MDAKDSENCALLHPLESPILILSRGLKVRPWHKSDASNLATQANNPKIAMNMRDTFPYPYTIDDARGFIAFNNNLDNWITRPSPGPDSGMPTCTFPPTYVIYQDETLVGSIGMLCHMGEQQRALVIGYWITESHWGRGIATEVLQAFQNWVWDKFPWIVRLEACVYHWNGASSKVLKKAGWANEGTKRYAIWKKIDDETTGLQDGCLAHLQLWALVRPMTSLRTTISLPLRLAGKD